MDRKNHSEKNPTNQHTSRKILLQQKLNVLYHTTDKRGRRRNMAKRKQKDGNGKMKPVNLWKTDNSE